MLDDNQNITDEGIASLMPLPLKSIALSNTRITNKSLAYLGQIKTLQRVRIDHTDITDDGVKLFKPLSGLRCLRIGGGCRGFSKRGLEFIASNFPSLKILDIGDSNLRGSELRCLTKLKRLDWLGLEGLRIDDADCPVVAKIETHTLDLSSSTVSNRFLDYAAGMRNLRRIIFYACPRITDEGVARLQKARPMLEIERQLQSRGEDFAPLLGQ